ncbi:hypothetical protein BCR35DRAFT_305273 [Leucosporidium creatinivorum]|uniref:DNA mismatch repair protein MutL n=1 Tax=Leucosporidium creatinivorum TaxID=106004 RepID=A0A1Y2F3N0_9BASI|nr:hypothetical protein BCR35DRAFT_305273 [Leucosporidium creatinivorum]
MSIQAIDHSSIHRLTSGQVVIDLQTAVKELLENALDAGATSVVIQFREHGVESIEVQDNGRGISEENWAGIALKHHTSKLTSFADLDSVATLGFRGEALSSLCGTATLSIITATAETVPAGTNLSFAHSGECIVGGKAARSKGTTVVVKELFKALPVRRKELIKNAKREFGKAVDLVQSYALIKTGCRFEVKNVVKGKSSTHLQTPPAASVRANFSSIFSPKSLVTMMDLDLDLDVEADKSVLKWSEDRSGRSTQVLVKGLVSKPTTGNGRTASNRQFFYVNGRPFAPAKVAKAFNEVYKTFNTGSFPAIVADFQLPPDAYDVNVSPDKRTIFLHSEGNLITALKAALEEIFQPSRSTFAMSTIGASTSKDSASSLKRISSTASKPATSSSPPRSSKTASTPAPSDDEKDEDEDPQPVKKKRRTSSTSQEVDSIDIEMEDGENGQIEPSAQRESPAPTTSQATPTGDLEEEPTPLFNAVPDGSSPPPSPRRQASLSPAASAAPRERSPSPVNRSPSPAPPAKVLRQITLDTSQASWARKSTASAGDSVQAASTVKKSFKSSIRQYLNPTQRGAEEDEVEEEEEELDVVGEEDEEEQRKDELEGEDEGADEGARQEEESRAEIAPSQVIPTQVAEDSDDDGLLVVESSYRAPSTVAEEEDDDDDIEIVEGSCNCARSGKHEHDGDSQMEEEALAQERMEHLASLDAADSSTPLPNAPPAPRSGLSFDLGSIVADWTTRPLPNAPRQPSADAETTVLVGAGLHQDSDEAEATLSRVVTKGDFESMKVIGQFNHAFIIARRKVSGSEGHELQDDLFIVDQHASDEKYNFERLQVDTVIQSQRLIQPRSLNLPSHDEITAMEHLELLRLNGFEVLVDEDADVGERVKLLAQPVSKDTVFGVEDFEELLELIKSSSTGEIVRPSKARKMFASRACRRSVMFGKPLTSNQMTTSCPHGRPTLRWLAGLGDVSAKDRRADIASVIGAYEPEGATQ